MINQSIHQQNHVYFQNYLQEGQAPSKNPISCEYCSKIFRYKSSYLEHVMIHTGERPFPCDYCNHRFTRRSNLKNHLLNVHKISQILPKKPGKPLLELVKEWAKNNTKWSYVYAWFISYSKCSNWRRISKLSLNFGCLFTCCYFDRANSIKTNLQTCNLQDHPVH